MKQFIRNGELAAALTFSALLLFSIGQFFDCATTIVIASVSVVIAAIIIVIKGE